MQVQKYYIAPRVCLISSLKLFPDISPYGGDADPMVTPTLMYGRKYSKGLNVITAVAMTAFHILSVAAFFFIDAGAIATAVVLYFMGGMLGIGMAYHRLLTHRSYKTPKWVEYFLTWCGTLAFAARSFSLPPPPGSAAAARTTDPRYNPRPLLPPARR